MDAVWLEDGLVSVRRVPAPEPPAGEALVRVLRAGICNTDLELIAGYYPFRGILGHEFVGRVEAGSQALVGQRVVGEINAVCRRCPECLAGRSNHCQQRTVLGILGRDGAFAELLTLPAANLHLVPPQVSDDAATLAEPLAAALQVQEQVVFRPGDRVLVVGPGKLGQLIARTLALTECSVTVLGRRREALALLEDHGLPTIRPDLLVERTFDVAVECTGNAEGFELARRALRPRGTLIMKSTYRGALTFDPASLVVDEITLVGSRCGPFPTALAVLASGRLEIEDLIVGRYPLASAAAALEHAARPGALKILLDIG
jgi:threonine dehydrogenase-like Zn-dependent dehydrogenase